MEEWINASLGNPTFSPTVLFAALLLGLLGAVGSCCNIAVIGALAGYSGSIKRKNIDRHMMLVGLSFMIGTMIALSILGAVTGFVSQTVGDILGMYWKIFAGGVMVFLGLSTLKLLPFSLPKLKTKNIGIPKRAPQALVYGLSIGGGTTVCSACCNPVLPVALGVVTLQGHTMWGAAILGTFAFGYSLPMALALIGLSIGFTNLSTVLGKYSQMITQFAGSLLIAVGLYLLATA